MIKTWSLCLFVVDGNSVKHFDKLCNFLRTCHASQCNQQETLNFKKLLSVLHTVLVKSCPINLLEQGGHFRKQANFYIY